MNDRLTRPVLLGEGVDGQEEVLFFVNSFYNLFPAFVMGVGPIKFSCFSDQIPMIERIARRFEFDMEIAEIEIPGRSEIGMSPSVVTAEEYPWVHDRHVVMTPRPSRQRILSAEFVEPRR